MSEESRKTGIDIIGSEINDKDKTKRQLIYELVELRQRIVEFEASNTERKRAKEELRESEGKYRSLFRDMLNGIAYCKIQVDENNQPVDFVYCEVNDAFEKLTGLKKQDVVGKKVTEVIPGIKESHPDLFSIYGKVALTGEGTKFDLYFKPLAIWLTISAYSPRKGYFTVVFDNVTGRKQTEKARQQESEEKFRAAVETLLDGFAIFSAVHDEAGHIVDFRYEYINEAGCRLNRRSYGEQIGHTLLGLLPEHKGTGLFDEYVQVVETGQPLARKSVLYEDVFGGGQRLVRVFDFQAVKLNDGFAVTWRDITEHKLAEEKIRQSEEKYRNLVTSSNDIVYSGEGAAAKWIFLSPSVRKILGYEPEEMVGRPVFDFMLPKDIESSREAYKQIIEGGKQFWDYENRWISKDGRIVTIVWNFVAILDKHGNVMGTQGVGRDITERKRAKEGIQEAAILKELDRLRTELLANVSHELRTPLTTIKGYSTMLLDYDTRLRHNEKRQYLESIDKATDRLLRLIDQLIDMSRLEAGLMEMEKAITSISKLIREAVVEAQIRAPRRKLVLNLPKRLPRVNIDARHIREVLDNLIDNAIKYSGEGQEVVVSARRVRRRLLISIADQGVGIPADELEKVFNRMYRSKQRLSDGPGGMGLGLTICQKLVAAHGGRIWVKSEEGKGSTLAFTLPLAIKRKRQ